MDGPGVANHVDELIAEPGIDAIQWAQGVGDDEPIMQWVPLIKRIQQGGKAVVVDLKPAEDNIQEDILKRLDKWR